MTKQSGYWKRFFVKFKLNMSIHSLIWFGKKIIEELAIKFNAALPESSLVIILSLWLELINVSLLSIPEIFLNLYVKIKPMLLFIASRGFLYQSNIC